MYPGTAFRMRGNTRVRLVHTLFLVTSREAMKNLQVPFCCLMAASLLLPSCSYSQFGAVAAGSSLGGMFGSGIGGLMGGSRGADKGTLAGMVIGGVVGAAVTSSSREKTEAPSAPAENYDDVDVYNRRSSSDDVLYGTYNSPRYQSPAAGANDLRAVGVDNLHFLDANDNRCLDREEDAFIVMDIYNRGRRTLYNVTPRISCDSRKVIISPAAAISSLQPGQGVRYKAAVRATGRVKKGCVVFTVSFGTGRQAVSARQFSIRTLP